MKKSKLPLPVLVLISATLFLFSSSFAEWIASPSTSTAPPRETTKQQEAAIVYVRAMSWVAQLISHPSAHPEMDADCAQTGHASHVSNPEMTVPRVQLCVVSKFPRPSRILCRSWQLTIQSSPHSLTRLVTEQRTSEN